MKFLLIALAFTTLLCCMEAGKYDYVGKYLIEHEERYKPPMRRNNAGNLLKNSNTIGLGYNPLYGSPVCYTGKCQGDGFRGSVFKLSYVESPVGSCTSEIIPDSVQLHCIPSANLQASTETISTLAQLSESTLKGISFGAELKYKMFSASYSHSEETQFMIDQIVKQSRTAMFTRGQVTFGKLTMFEPSMELSANFKHVIEEMPCCDYNSEVEEYINEYFIDYFGLTFVKELILGGIAQEIVFIGNNEIQEMQSKGVDVSQIANVGFFLTFNIKSTSSYNKTQQEQFMKSVKYRYSTKLGGDPSIETMNDWIKSVPENPIILNYVVKDILTLVSLERFPNDTQINNKSKLIKMAIEKYMDKEKVICLNNCTHSSHGQCSVSSSARFQLGTCVCRSGWTGYDCSEKEPYYGPATAMSGNVQMANGQFMILGPLECYGDNIHLERIIVESIESDTFYVSLIEKCSAGYEQARQMSQYKVKDTFIMDDGVAHYFSNTDFCLGITCSNWITDCKLRYSANVGCMRV